MKKRAAAGAAGFSAEQLEATEKRDALEKFDIISSCTFDKMRKRL